MKISLDWLREWVNVPWSPAELGSRLTMAGFELEAIAPAAPAFDNVVVAEIVTAERHPQADRLQVCRVNFGGAEAVQIVCGAANARAGLKTALARVGAELPGGLAIKAAKLRGVESSGMLCSAKELGLAETSDGIVELPADAPVGKSVREFLALDDTILELNVTPNRGDAMSVIGIAREVATLTKSALCGPKLAPVAPAGQEAVRVALDWPQGCPKFAGRIIRGIDNRRATPIWMRERLRRAGVRSISPIVDVTNYVMLELGQPMHAYDHAKLVGTVHARAAREGERITLLDGKTHDLSADVLVIADDESAIGIAGIMGGARTSVTDGTTDVFFEAAFFAPSAIAGRARRYGLQTDASQRFERGVDPNGPERAIERATALLCEIAGGTPQVVRVESSAQHLPQPAKIALRGARIARLLGVSIPDQEVERVLRALDMKIDAAGEGWSVTPPARRFDVSLEADLIEEVARIVGYGAIPETVATTPRNFRPLPEARAEESDVLRALADRGYLETITFAFVDPQFQKQLFPDAESLALANPIASDLAVMRVSLIPGLVKALGENLRRQADRVRLFEHGTRFVVQSGALTEVDTLAGIAGGLRQPEQWGAAKADADFYDVKKDVEALIASTGTSSSFSFEPATLSCLHPGRTARILRDGQPVGWIGELHPALVSALDLTYVPVIFEIDFSALRSTKLPAFAEVSRFPQVRRDLAVVIDEDVALSRLRERVTLVASSLLRELRVFDVYRGPGVEKGRKSVALGLIFQENSRTLTDADADGLMAAIRADLSATVNARVRE